MEKASLVGSSDKPVSFEGKKFQVENAPLDSEGYVESFNVEDEESWMTFFNKFGFVVIKEILSTEEIEKSIDDIWNLVESYHKIHPISRNNTKNWKYWPGLNKLGIFSQALSFHAWQNRANPKMYNVFKTLMGREDLWVSIDNWGTMRPTKDIPQTLTPAHIRTTVDTDDPSVTKTDEPSWKSKSNWLHWDLNPFIWESSKNEGLDYTFACDFISENNGTKNIGDLKLQGLLNLIDAREQDGGFVTIPGFFKHLKEWTEQSHLQEYASKHQEIYDFVYVPKNDPMQLQPQKIPMRAGSLLIWRSEQPHANYGNDSERFRMVQYVKMFVAQNGKPGTKRRRELMASSVPPALQQTEMQRKLFGIQDYSPNL
eukprot:TRINITY_DN7773_c0_g1_i1.p1 TRINITY_DN7773_c0_g1~~TRINITY_DN7773_c0_g1_i1.p1  ORF type:complete len:370 (+),score=80.55 TRINITY_DN7773_c0_g1_i1:124-1233(+)